MGADATIRPEDVIIVVLNWNRRDDTLACLASLEAARFGGATALVVDNGSCDGSVEAVRERFPAVDALALDYNHGYAGGNNVGIRAALAKGAKAVLVLNNDTTVAPDFLGWLTYALNHDARAAAVSSAILRQDCPEVLDVAYLDVYFGHGLVHRRGVNALPGEGFDALKRVEAGVGTCLLLRAEALAAVGLFDETYFAYHEEVDWCFRARKLGWQIYFQPLSRVWHHGSRSTVSAARPPRDDGRPGRPQLGNPVPLSWNPVRSYLGARNAVRFVRTHATIPQRLYFCLSTSYAVPLALLAVVADREEELMLGLWTYRRALAALCVPDASGRRGVGAVARAALRAPRALLWSLPRELRRAYRERRTAQIEEHLRGLRDGALGRPLPLVRLGLR
jgi:GT2 family glycosyltransferase